MIVAAIAWDKLTPAVKKEATRLLKENPDYENWTRDAGTGQNVDQIAFIMAATWPDEIKGERNYDNSEGDHPKKGAESGQNIGYDDKLQHRYWHFYDEPYSATEPLRNRPTM